MCASAHGVIGCAQAPKDGRLPAMPESRKRFCIVMEDEPRAVSE